MRKRSSTTAMQACAGRAAAAVLGCVAAWQGQPAAAQVPTPTVTYRVAVESNAGMDGGMAWQSVFLLNDGRIASFGTGNHAPNQSNAMRIIDPVTNPTTVQSYDLFPWTQNIAPPSMTSGTNLYVSNYDNHASIYIPGDNKAIWVNHGVFDFGARTWTYGDRPPLTQDYRQFLDDSANSMAGVFNPAVAWCSALDKGIWFGNSAGGFGQDFDVMTVIERSAPGAVKPWKLTPTDMGSQSVAGLHYARNTAVCIGEHLYVGGPKAAGGGNAFYKIHVPTKTRAATLTPYPVVTDEYFPQMVYDSSRNHLVVIGIRVFDYDIAADMWRDVTPTGWRGYRNPMGVYHPIRNAIYFRGSPLNSSVYGEHFEWHKMTFSLNPGDSLSPNPPTAFSAN
jgi:hypothetical protein